MVDLLERQIELEKQMTTSAIEKYNAEVQNLKQSNSFGSSAPASQLMSRILGNFSKVIDDYLNEYTKGKAVRSTIAARCISKLETKQVAFIATKCIFNVIYTVPKLQLVAGQIGQAVEDEWKMQECQGRNKFYFKTIQKDLNSRGAKANRKKYITTGVFSKKLDFHLDRWTASERIQTGQLLVHLFQESTGLIHFDNRYEKNKTIKYVVPTDALIDWFTDINTKLEVMQPFFLPMVHRPKEWIDVLDGGYLSPYLRRNKLIKNNSKGYLKTLSTADMPIVYEAINHLQSTEWQINREVLEVVNKLWEDGRAIAELPDRDDEVVQPYPYPELTKDDAKTEEQLEVIKRWKRETYEIHKKNVAKRSNRILVSQVLRIANQFRDYEKIYFPYQMDFRGRLYPIPVLLQPQGTDLSKGLLRFAEGKGLKDEASRRWFYIHGANVYGYDKANYDDRIKWVEEHKLQIMDYVDNPTENIGWSEADKPFQFLAWCFEYVDYIRNPDSFVSHIPIQLDGTCNGLQHYSALLRDPVGGRNVNLTDSEVPSDIYKKVAEKLEEKLNDIQNNINDNYSSTDITNARHYLQLGINRKLTKRPVMVLPYGGTRLSCREYIGAYLTDNYSSAFLWEHFNVGNNPTDCVFKVSTWLSKYLWEAITDTLKAAIVGMDYIKKLARLVNKEHKYIEWLTPVGLLVRQEYKSRKKKTIQTNLYGTIYYTEILQDVPDTLDSQRQINGICPNFIHSLDAACLMLYLHKCKEKGINSFMTVHDCYGTHAADTEESAKLLRESFVEIYRKPIIENFTEDVLSELENLKEEDKPEIPEKGSLDIEEVLNSSYFFN